MTHKLPPQGRSAAETELANSLKQLPPDVLDDLKQLSPEFLARLGQISADALDALTRLPLDLLARLSEFSVESLEWIGLNGSRLAMLPPSSLTKLAQMASGQFQVGSTLKHVPTEAIRALSQLPPEVVENLSNLAPEILKQLPDALSATAETMAEIPQNLGDLSKDDSLPPKSDATLELSPESLATLSELPPEAVTTIAQLNPEEIATLSELSPELVSTISQLPEDFAGSLSLSEMATVTELDPKLLSALSQQGADKPKTVVPPKIFAQISAIGPAKVPVWRSLLEEARSMHEITAAQSGLEEEFVATDSRTLSELPQADPEGETRETLPLARPLGDLTPPSKTSDTPPSKNSVAPPTSPAARSRDEDDVDDADDDAGQTVQNDDWSEGLSALGMDEASDRRLRAKSEMESADFSQELNPEGVSDDDPSYQTTIQDHDLSADEGSSQTVNLGESRYVDDDEGESEVDSFTGTVLSDEASVSKGSGGSDDVDSNAQTLQSDDISAAVKGLRDDDSDGSNAQTVLSDDSFSVDGLSAFDRSGDDATMQTSDKTRVDDDDSFGATLQMSGIHEASDDDSFGATLTDDSLAGRRKPGSSDDGDSFAQTVQSDDSLSRPGDDDSYGATVQSDASFSAVDDADSNLQTVQSHDGMTRPHDDDSYSATVQSDASFTSADDDDSYGATVQSDDSLAPPQDDDSYGATVQSGDHLSQADDDGSFATVQSDASFNSADEDMSGATMMSDAGLSQNDDNSALTMQSDGSAAASGSVGSIPGRRSEDDDLSFSNTLASASDLPPDQKQSMAENWGHVSGGDPGQTMKGAERRAKAQAQSQAQSQSQGQSKAQGGSQTTTQGSLVITKRKLGTRAVPEFNKDGRLPEPKDPEFELLKILGEGGMGVVFEARQRSIDREVAMKMLKAKSAKDKEQRAKFLTEAVVTGELDHPNIVPIYDLGATHDDALFYAMKKVEGTPWLKVVKTKSVSENLNILMRVADAVAFAHSRGVIHRDLKPENVMLGAFGVVLVMDWGLAYSTAEFRKSSSITQNTSMGGTPAYMAPEMATGPINKIGPHSDVYLLGAILFEVVNGKPPHAGKNAMKCLMAAARNEIREPDQETVNRNDPTGELLAIAMKAMAKEPKDRYRSVLEFQKAVEEFNSHTESVTLSTRATEDLKTARDTDAYNDYARAVFAFEEAYDMWKGNKVAHQGVFDAKLAYAQSAKRRGDLDLGMGQLELSIPAHKQLYDELNHEVQEREARKGRIAKLRKTVIAVGLIGFIGVSGALVAAEFARREAVYQEGVAKEQTAEAVKQKGIAEENEKEAKRQEDIAKENEKEAKRQEGIAIANADEAKKQTAEAKRQQGIAVAKAEEARLSAIEAKKQEGIAIAKAEEARLSAIEAKKQEGIAVVKAKEANDARMKAEEAQKVAEKAQKDEAIAKADAIKQKTLAEKNADEAKKNADEATKQAMIAKKNADEAKKQEMIAVAAADEAKKQKEIADVKRLEAELAQKAEQYQGYIAKIGLADAKIRENAFDVAISILQECPDDLRNWEWGRLNYLAENSKDKFDNAAPVHALALSPDGEFFVTGEWNENGAKAVVWNNSTRAKVRELQHKTNYIHAVAWSPNGELIATGSAEDGQFVQLWNAKTGEKLPIQLGKAPEDRHSGEVFSVQFSKDSSKLLTASDDTTARLYDVKSGELLVEYAEGTREIASVDKNGKPIKRTVRYRGHTAKVRCARFSPNEDRVVTGGDDGALVWDAKTGDASPPFIGHDGPVYAVAFSPDGSKIASGGYDKRVLIWRREDLIPLNYAALEIGGDVKPVQKFGALDGHTGAVWSLAFSADGRSLLSGSEDNTIRLWNVDLPLLRVRNNEQTRVGEFVKAFRGHNGQVRAVAFVTGKKSELDDQVILSASRDNRIKKWSVKQYSEIRELQSRMLEGHVDAVMAAGFSKDGKRIATASRDRTARTWSTDNGKLLQTFREGHDFLTSNAVYFANGKRLATTAVDNTVRVWDTDTQTQLLMIGNVGRGGALAVSPDGKWLMTGASDRVAQDGAVKLGLFPVQLFDATTGKLQRQLIVPAAEQGSNSFGRNEVSSLAFSPNGKFVLAADKVGRAVIWNLETGKATALKGHAAQIRINAVAFVDDSLALTASSDNTVAQWDVATGEEKKSLLLKHGFESGVNAMAVHPTKRQVLTASEDNKVRLWDLATAKVVTTFTADFTKATRLNGVAIHASGDWVLAADGQADNPQTVLWKLDGSAEVKPTKVLKSENALWTAIFTPDASAQSVLAVGGAEARVINVAQNAVRETFSQQDKVASVAFSPRGDRIVTASWDQQARIWNSESGADELKLGGDDRHQGLLNSAMFSSHDDGQMVLTSSADGTAKVWDAKTGKLLKTLNGHGGKAVRYAAFSIDGKKIVTAADDSTAIVWDAATGKSLTHLKGHSNPVLFAQFSEDGSKVITGSEDSLAIVWDVESGKAKLKLAGHTGNVTSVGFAPGGNRAVTAGQDNTVKLWDVSAGAAKMDVAAQEKNEDAKNGDGKNAEEKIAEGKEILTLAGHTRGVTSVTFSPDGRYVLTGSEDGRAILWLTTDWSAPGEKKPEQAVTAN